MPNFLAFILLTTIAGLGDPFAPELPNPAPQTAYSQSLSLHPGWNLVSWHIIPPDPTPQNYLQMIDILPLYESDPPYDPTWFNTKGGKLYKWNSMTQYWPPDYQTDAWDLNYAYYIELQAPHNWNEFQDCERFPLGDISNIIPSSAWAHDQNVGEPGISYWFFMGYAAPGYCKLASISIDPIPSCGAPALFTYEGPFHWLIWQNLAPEFPLGDLKVVKEDQGKVYIHDPDPVNHRLRAVDQIGVLEPGRGYFLGFSDDGPYTFVDGWNGWPQWQNDNYVPPELPGSGRGVASSAHFQYQPYTHWSYPIVIDTVDLGTTPLTAGDEIAVFDGDRCVGAKSYQGEFPVVLIAWEDDIATPMEVDGYGFGNPMTFLWYDASENAEVEFTLPPETQALPNDPVTPSNGGFGMGLYARRSLMEGPSSVTQLPQEYRIKQNFPNPFNAETVIPLELPQRSNVKLEIFNVKGQLLGLPFEHVYDAGWPKIRWNASRLPSGIYFYRITAEGLERGGKFVDAGKMLVLK